MAELSFKNKLKKSLNIEFIDGKKISVLFPSKAMYDVLSEYKHAEDKLDELYSLMAELLSRNIEAEKISAEYLENTLDLDDVIVLYRGYQSFLEEVLKNPN